VGRPRAVGGRVRDAAYDRGGTAIAFSTYLCMSAGEFDLAPVKNCQKVLIVETWVHQIFVSLMPVRSSS
jgi:hypothetical protein